MRSKKSAPYTLAYKTSNSPMLTFRPVFWAEMLQASPEAATLAWAKLRYDLKPWYPNIRLNPDQVVEWNRRIGVDEHGMWTSRYAGLEPPWYRIVHCYTDGLMLAGQKDIEQNLQDILVFYTAIDRGIADGTIQHKKSLRA